MRSSLSISGVGRSSIRRPRRALGLWLLFVIVSVAVGSAVGTMTLSNGAVGESARGYSIMSMAAALRGSTDTSLLAFRAERGAVITPEMLVAESKQDVVLESI